jgi:hypothetical protein
VTADSQLGSLSTIVTGIGAVRDWVRCTDGPHAGGPSDAKLSRVPTLDWALPELPA